MGFYSKFPGIFFFTNKIINCIRSRHTTFQLFSCFFESPDQIHFTYLFEFHKKRLDKILPFRIFVFMDHRDFKVGQRIRVHFPRYRKPHFKEGTVRAVNQDAIRIKYDQTPKYLYCLSFKYLEYMKVEIIDEEDYCI